MKSCTARRRGASANLAAVFCLLAFSSKLYAQRTNVVGASIDVVGGLTNNQQLVLPVLGQPVRREKFYSVFPSVTLASTGKRSELNANYVFGWNRLDTQLPTDSTSHAASLSLAVQVGARSTFDFADSYSRTNDIQSFYALRGVQQTEEDLVFLFSPITTQQAYTTNNSSVSYTHAFSERSTLSISGTGSLRLYDNEVFRTLSDQQVIGATVGYSRRLNERLSWTLQDSTTYFNFDSYTDSVSHVVRTGFTYSFGRNTTGSFTAGPSFVKQLGVPETVTSYELTASLQQQIQKNSFNFTFSQDHGSVTGFGSVSQVMRATVSFSRTLGRRVSVSADATGFESKGIFEDTSDQRGISGSANMGFELAKGLSLHGGVQLQRYSEVTPFEATQKRVFVSLSYGRPNLLRWR